ncbi:MAG: signal peptidase I [Deferribacteraceae bacterium]|nr:signal peptidase I [Deferribacteraceae bacterium]
MSAARESKFSIKERVISLFGSKNKTESVNVITDAKPKRGIKDFIDSLIIAFVIAMFIRTFFISAYRIPSGSMEDTLLIGDHILASKIHYIVSDPKFGDIAVFEYPLEPDKDFIKRVIGEPGDRIRFEGKTIYRNGERLTEPYAKFYTMFGDDFREFTVPGGYYLMLGDNRDTSFDGRYWGFVPRNAFKGKSLIIYFSLAGKGLALNRMFSLTR